MGFLLEFFLNLKFFYKAHKKVNVQFVQVTLTAPFASYYLEHLFCHNSYFLTFYLMSSITTEPTMHVLHVASQTKIFQSTFASWFTFSYSSFSS